MSGRTSVHVPICGGRIRQGDGVERVSKVYCGLGNAFHYISMVMSRSLWSCGVKTWRIRLLWILGPWCKLIWPMRKWAKPEVVGGSIWKIRALLKIRATSEPVSIIPPGSPEIIGPLLLITILFGMTCSDSKRRRRRSMIGVFRHRFVGFLQPGLLHFKHRFCSLKAGKGFPMFDDIDDVVKTFIQSIEHIHDESAIRDRGINVCKKVRSGFEFLTLCLN